MIHHTFSRESPAIALVTNGAPLSDRITAGSPRSRNTRSTTDRAPAYPVEPKPSTARRKRVCASAIVSG